MDYNKMNKEELIELCKNNQHLATTVQAKDKEINELKNYKEVGKEVEVFKEEVKRLKIEKQQLKNRLYDLEQGKEKDLEKRTNEARADVEKKLAEAQKVIEQLKEYAQRREGELNKYVNSYGDLLKVIQGATDTAVRLNSYMIADVKK